MSFDLRYALAVVMRRLHWVALCFVAVTALAAAVALLMTPVYQSSARLLMENAQIPDSLATPTVDTAALEQLQIVEQRLMTRQNLLDIARKFNALRNMDRMTPDEIVEGMRRATRIDKQAERDQATLMTITFSGPQAGSTAAVVNEYVTRILADNTSMRASQAQDTLQFFNQEVQRLSTDLSTQSAAILEFQRKNSDALPDSQAYRLDLQSTLQERLAAAERDRAGLHDQKQRLIDLYRSTGELGNATQDPDVIEMNRLQTELTRAKAVYAPTNPKIALLERTIAELRARMQGTPEAGGKPATVTPLDVQTMQIDAQIRQIDLQIKDLTAQLERVTDAINRSSAVAIQLSALQRDYDNTQDQYNIATDRLSKASTGERIEALAKGQRIGVVEAASVPDKPAKPNRVMIVIMGAMAGLGLGFGLILLAELMSSAVRRPVDLERRLEITALGVIPYIKTPQEALRRRSVLGLCILALIILLPLAIWLIDTEVMPIDLILSKIAKKLNF
jgi:uncharacterized protein involved in exopolysaccharide biosynthesis